MKATCAILNAGDGDREKIGPDGGAALNQAVDASCRALSAVSTQSANDTVAASARQVEHRLPGRCATPADRIGRSGWRVKSALLRPLPYPPMLLFAESPELPARRQAAPTGIQHFDQVQRRLPAVLRK